MRFLIDHVAPSGACNGVRELYAAAAGRCMAGERGAHADAGGEEGALDLLARNFEQGGDAIGVVAFDIAKQEDHALVGGQLPERLLHLGALDVAAAEGQAGTASAGGGLLVERHALAELV